VPSGLQQGRFSAHAFGDCLWVGALRAGTGKEVFADNEPIRAILRKYAE
jgi:hypothetical protein